MTWGDYNKGLNRFPRFIPRGGSQPIEKAKKKEAPTFVSKSKTKTVHFSWQRRLYTHFFVKTRTSFRKPRWHHFTILVQQRPVDEARKSS